MSTLKWETRFLLCLNVIAHSLEWSDIVRAAATIQCRCSLNFYMLCAHAVDMLCAHAVDTVNLTLQLRDLQSQKGKEKT